MNNNSNTINIEKTTKYKTKEKFIDEYRSAWFMVITLILGWLGTLLIMMNGGHGFI